MKQVVAKCGFLVAFIPLSLCCLAAPFFGQHSSQCISYSNRTAVSANRSTLRVVCFALNLIFLSVSTLVVLATSPTWMSTFQNLYFASNAAIIFAGIVFISFFAIPPITRVIQWQPTRPALS